MSLWTSLRTGFMCKLLDEPVGGLASRRACERAFERVCAIGQARPKMKHATRPF